jgi:DNA-binding transcriptional LysR family regulator
MQMDFSQLSVFVTLTECRQFSEDAESENISQSSLSKQIKAMEDEIGARLFLRGAKGVELTAVGGEFLFFARRVLEEKRDMQMKVAAHVDTKNRTSTIMIMPVMTSFGISGLIADFRRDYPQYRLDILEKGTRDIARLLDASAVDMALVGTGIADFGKYLEHSLFIDPFHVAVSSKHPLAGESEIDLKALKNEPFIQLEDSIGINNIVIKACRDEGFEPNIAYSCKVVPSALSMVRQGFGALLFTEQELRTFRPPGVELIKLRGNLCGKLVLAVRKTYKPNQADKAFINYTLKRYNLTG